MSNIKYRLYVNEAGNWLHLKLNRDSMQRQRMIKSNLTLGLRIAEEAPQEQELEGAEVLAGLETKPASHWKRHQPRTPSLLPGCQSSHHLDHYQVHALAQQVGK